MASMMPTETECLAIDTLEKLRVECEVKERNWAAFSEKTGALETKIRNLAILPAAVVADAIRKCRVLVTAELPGGVELSPRAAPDHPGPHGWVS